MIPEWNFFLPACPDDAHAEIKIEQREQRSVEGDDGGHGKLGIYLRLNRRFGSQLRSTSFAFLEFHEL
jgi:hypothetical protein